MSKYRRTARLAATFAVGALVLAACGGDDEPAAPGGPPASGHEFNVSTTRIINPSTQAGGTLRLGAGSDCDSWDPAIAYYGYCWNLQRLYARTLVTFAPDPTRPTDLEPDLATAVGTPNADFTQFTYTLKDGIKYEDGTPITSQDVKYAVERNFATDVIFGGPNAYLHCMVDTCTDGAPQYKGPYSDADNEPMVNGQPSIQTPDEKTIVFNLAKANASFDYLLAMGTASPIPQAKDTGEDYTQDPIASGPFKIDTYDRDTGITFVRNDQWDQATDTVRKPLLDRIEIEYISNLDDLDQRLKTGTLDARVDGDIQPTFQTEAFNDPNLKKYIDNPVDGALSYLVVMPQVAPFDNIDCRKAVFQAVDKTTYLLAFGGANNGEIAVSPTPAGLPGYDNTVDKIPNGADHTGDVAAAQASLQACGQPDGFTTNLAFVPQGTGPARATAVQEALARVGITVELAPGEAETYYGEYIGTTQSVVDNKLGIAFAGWGADYPDSNGFWFAIAHGDANSPVGDSNYPDLDDDAVDGFMDQALQAPKDQWDAIGRQLDDAIMDTAVFVPMVHSKSVYWRADRLTNVYSTQFFGLYDWVNMGVADGQ